jgi:hypothetical protein
MPAADFLRTGCHVAAWHGTASGKSLAYQLPVVTHLLQNPRRTAQYLSPTNAVGVPGPAGRDRELNFDRPSSSCGPRNPDPREQRWGNLDRDHDIEAVEVTGHELCTVACTDLSRTLARGLLALPHS